MLLGQDKALSQLKKFVRTRRVPHSFIFYGPAGVGKALAAKTLAKILNCQDAASNAEQTFCSRCISCKSIENNTHPDFMLADFAYQANLTGKELEKQQHISVDTIRRITAASQQKAAMGGWKVLVVDRAETMQAEAQNAMLKFIEEPPAKTVWILISAKKSALLPTIQSRSQALAFAPLEEAVLNKILLTEGLDKTSVEEASKYAGGSVSKALLAAEMLGIISGLDVNSPAFPFELASELDRTLAVARTQAKIILDMFYFGLHTLWAKETGDKKDALKTALEKTALYRRAIERNVSPHLVVENAFMQNSNFVPLIF